MKKSTSIFLAIIMTVNLFAGSSQWLKENTKYQKSSYYKAQVYSEYDAKSFYQLKDIYQVIKIDSLDIHLLNACLFFTCNQLRAMYKLPPFLFNANLKDAATIHSWQMAKYHFFDHNNPYNSSLKTLSNRFDICKLEYSTYGENCHKHYIADNKYTYIKLAQDIIESLYKSPPHKQNMLDRDFSFSAVGVALEKSQREAYILVTQDFYSK